MSDQRLKLLKDNIKAYPDFPKAGIVFQDIFGAMRKGPVLKALMELVKEYAESLKDQIDCIVALDSRGFLFGTLMASELEIPFIPIRKKGKLPGACSTVSYDLEYGSAQFELQENAFEFCGGQKRVLIVDDLMATGGTMKAACDLVEKKAKVTHVFVIMELEFLQGKEKLDKNIHFKSLLSYD